MFLQQSGPDPLLRWGVEGAQKEGKQNTVQERQGPEPCNSFTPFHRGGTRSPETGSGSECGWLPARGAVPAASHPVLVSTLQGPQATLQVGKHSSQSTSLELSMPRTCKLGRSLPLQALTSPLVFSKLSLVAEPRLQTNTHPGPSMRNGCAQDGSGRKGTREQATHGISGLHSRCFCIFPHPLRPSAGQARERGDDERRGQDSHHPLSSPSEKPRPGSKNCISPGMFDGIKTQLLNPLSSAQIFDSPLFYLHAHT